MCLVVAKKWSYNLLLSETHGWSILIEKLDRWRHEHPASITHHHHRWWSVVRHWLVPSLHVVDRRRRRKKPVHRKRQNERICKTDVNRVDVYLLAAATLVSMLLRVESDRKKNHPNRCTQVEIGKPHPVDWMMVIDAVRSNTYLHIPTGLYLMMSLS